MLNLLNWRTPSSLVGRVYLVPLRVHMQGLCVAESRNMEARGELQRQPIADTANSSEADTHDYPLLI